MELLQEAILFQVCLFFLGRARRIRLLAPLCLPAQWSAPVIAGDGAVYVGRADGKMHLDSTRIPVFSSVINQPGNPSHPKTSLWPHGW